MRNEVRKIFVNFLSKGNGAEQGLGEDPALLYGTGVK